MRKSFFSLALLFSAHNVMAISADEYCNDMYPPGSYDEVDRAIYVQECLDAYLPEESSESADPEPTPEEFQSDAGTPPESGMDDAGSEESEGATSEDSGESFQE